MKIFKMIYISGVIFCSCLAFTATGSLANTQESAQLADQKKEMSIEERWGVKVEALRISAEGNLIDFRYRIIDPEKASYLVDRRNKAYLMDQESGKVLSVPNTAKVGPLRQTVRYGLPKKDRVYFILFGSNHLIKPGNKMTVVIGDFRAEDIVVE